MARYNRTFDLSIEDIDLIETALRKVAAKGDEDGVNPRDASELLGRLHNHKIFYRPKSGVYVSG